MTDSTYMEWVSKHQTALKASRLASRELPASDLWIVPNRGVMRARLLEEDSAHWTVGDVTVNGKPVPPHITIAYKPHWHAPVEIVAAPAEDPAAVAETPPPETVYPYPAPDELVADLLPPEPQMEKGPDPAPSLWQRLFRRRS